MTIWEKNIFSLSITAQGGKTVSAGVTISSGLYAFKVSTCSLLYTWWCCTLSAVLYQGFYILFDYILMMQNCCKTCSLISCKMWGCCWPRNKKPKSLKVTITDQMADMHNGQKTWWSIDIMVDRHNGSSLIA